MTDWSWWLSPWTGIADGPRLVVGWRVLPVAQSWPWRLSLVAVGEYRASLVDFMSDRYWFGYCD